MFYGLKKSFQDLRIISEEHDTADIDMVILKNISVILIPIQNPFAIHELTVNSKKISLFKIYLFKLSMYYENFWKQCFIIFVTSQDEFSFA
jgi:hypothetical protein